VRRLFYGLEVDAPWPEQFPPGRLVDASSRHMTVEFLGDLPNLPDLSDAPVPPFPIGPVGQFDRVLFLPKRRANVVAWHIFGFDDPYFESLLCHVTLARRPFEMDAWKEAFEPLPCVGVALHLYESVGNLTYKPLWSHPLLPPFEELPHTADIAFRVRGETLQQLHRNAEVALCFKAPGMLPDLGRVANSFDEMVIALNDLVSDLDTREGSPFKAVSFSGELQEREGILEWEMIVDV
jgi:RNA 2',3'-cyclic 3'-phosphodiesterase